MRLGGARLGGGALGRTGLSVCLPAMALSHEWIDFLQSLPAVHIHIQIQIEISYVQSSYACALDCEIRV